MQSDAAAASAAAGVRAIDLCASSLIDGSRRTSSVGGLHTVSWREIAADVTVHRAL